VRPVQSTVPTNSLQALPLEGFFFATPLIATFAGDGRIVGKGLLDESPLASGIPA